MSVEFIRDIINYEKLVGEGISQTMVSGDIVVPDRNPEIEKVLNMDGKVVIISSEVIEDRVIVEGRMDFDILYASSEENKGIYKVNASSNFTHNIQVPSAQPKMSCKVANNIEHMGHELVSNKKIKVSAVVDIKGIVYEKEAIETITDIQGEEVQTLKNTMAIDEYIGENNSQNIIKGKIEVPENVEEVKEVLRKNVHIHKKDVMLLDGKAIINACALLGVLYESTNDEIGYAEQDIAFTQEVEMPEVKPNMKCDVSFKLEDAADNILENEDGARKIIDVEMGVGISTKVFMNREIETIIDGYSSQSRFEMQKENIKATSLFKENTDNQTLKERIVLPEDAKPIDMVKHVVTKPIITDVKMLEDKVLVEGVVNCCVLYMVTEGIGMASYEEEIPFKSTVDVPGAKIDMVMDTEANIEHMSFDKVSQKEIEVKVIVECSAKVFHRETLDIVRGIEEKEIPENIKNMPSIVIYSIQPHDTLWKVAKKYFTTVDDIVRINEIENPDNIQPGMKVLIPKKMFVR